jgi:hypothetical protein
MKSATATSLASFVRPVCIAAALLAATALGAAAQQPQTLRLRGTIDTVDGRTLGVTSRDGIKLTVHLADGAPVRTVIRKSLADVRAGGFVGITAVPQADGIQKAIEIHIFPEALRGTGEGHRPWDLVANSTMTNATIDSAVASVDGQTLVLKYRDGEKTFAVPANVVVVEFAPASAADLKPGVRVFAPAAKKLSDGTLEVPNIVVGRDGVDPPM